MKIVFRADASVNIGTGHIMRCLTLAERLKHDGADISFVCREESGNLIELVKAKGCRIHRLPQGIDMIQDVLLTGDFIQKQTTRADWLIIDHYAIDEQWETRMRTGTRRIMVIDDLADRPHDCDLLLDQNLYENMNSRYDDLVPIHCTKLLGPSYALLRPEFRTARAAIRDRDGSARRLMIFFGGSDPTNETEKALKAVSMVKRPDLAIDVIVGSSNPHSDKIKSLCAAMPNTTFHYQVTNMAQLMAEADLFVGAGGSTTWERCCLGLPSLVYSIAENQEAMTQHATLSGVQVYLGKSYEVSAELIVRQIQEFLCNGNKLQDMSRQSLKLVDGTGAGKIAESMKAIK